MIEDDSMDCNLDRIQQLNCQDYSYDSQKERHIINDNILFKGPEVADKIDENRDLNRLEVNCSDRASNTK